LEAVGLSQGSECFDNVFIFHDSIIVEIYDGMMTAIATPIRRRDIASWVLTRYCHIGSQQWFIFESGSRGHGFDSLAARGSQRTA
jgi:hypothetical protein